MQEINLIVEALQSRAWYPVAGIGVALVLKVLTIRTDWLFSVLPQKLQWLPAAVLMVGGAFVDAYQSGASWPVALGMAAYAAIAGTPMAVGTHHLGKRFLPGLKAEKPKGDDPPAPDSRRASLGSIALLALGAPLTLSRCAAAPIAAAWLPAVLAALSAAGTLLEQVEHWVDRFRTVLPSEFLGKCAQLLADCRAALEQVQQLAAKGAEFQAEAEKAYQRLRTLLDDLFALLATVGLYDAASERLTAPAPMRASDGSIAPTETMGVAMPPETLQ